MIEFYEDEISVPEERRTQKIQCVLISHNEDRAGLLIVYVCVGVDFSLIVYCVLFGSSVLKKVFFCGVRVCNGRERGSKESIIGE